ncbi:PREDICTED: uncharacterized protein C9orf43 homolog [Elephantulus edwardii]|uniref:uncharacterized protein C9orf43 homolog n=1 Tax=Elephantulus edwardii TaxID=28737 RepID=UPI0003F07B38|nr:PREDICTED: uncharacterized protein C9orf43 homolog [Elephantulus edwardii]
MNLPDESQWDETTCGSALCQHPQCWATTRRIERGHPRILGSPCKTLLETEDKLPALTVVNISNSSLLPKRLAKHHSPGFTFNETHSLLPWASKFKPKFQGRCESVSVLNLNKTLLPCHHDVKNTAVIWIPKEPKKHRNFSKGEQKAVTSSDMKIALAMMKKSRPLEKIRPDSAISSKMFLSIHHLTPQPAASQGAELVNAESIKQDISAQVELGLEFQTFSEEEEIPTNFSARAAGIPWKPELKLLRLLQDSDYEHMENQSSRTPSEESVGSQTEDMACGNQNT